MWKTRKESNENASGRRRWIPTRGMASLCGLMLFLGSWAAWASPSVTVEGTETAVGVNVGSATGAGDGQVKLKSASASPNVAWHSYKSTISDSTAGPSLGGTVSDPDESWTDDDNVKSDTDSGAYAYFTGPAEAGSNKLQITNFGFSLGSDATVDGIEVTICARTSQSTGSPLANVNLLKAGSMAGSGNSFAPTTSWVPYMLGDSTDLWNTTWSYSDVNATNFGAETLAWSLESMQTYEVDWLKIKIYYHTGGETEGEWMAGVYRDDGTWRLVKNTTSLNSDVKVAVDTNGKVGIGTASPATDLQIENTAESPIVRITRGSGSANLDPELQVYSDSSHIGGIRYDSGQGELRIYNSWVASGSDIVFYTSGVPMTATQRMIIEGTGDVGVGTSDPAYKLNVSTNEAGSIAYFLNDGDDANRTGIGIQTGKDSQSATTNYYVQCFDGAGDPVGGLQNASGTFGVYDVSDARRKDNIQTSPLNAIDAVKAVRVARYTFKRDPLSTDTLEAAVHDGFIAQELAAVVPMAVGTVTDPKTSETLYTTMRSTLIPVLWRAVQQQQEEIEALQGGSASGEAVAGAAGSAVVGASADAAVTEALLADKAFIEAVTAGVLEALGVDPWVEIPFDQAWEEVEETEPVEVVRTVAKYRTNWQTMTTDSYETEETVVEAVPTGRLIKRLKDGVRLDDYTGKYYRRVGLGGSAGDATAAALLRLAPRDVWERALRDALAARLEPGANRRTAMTAAPRTAKTAR